MRAYVCVCVCVCVLSSESYFLLLGIKRRNVRLESSISGNRNFFGANFFYFFEVGLIKSSISQNIRKAFLRKYKDFFQNKYFSSYVLKVHYVEAYYTTFGPCEMFQNFSFYLKFLEIHLNFSILIISSIALKSCNFLI